MTWFSANSNFSTTTELLVAAEAADKVAVEQRGVLVTVAREETEWQ